MEARWLIGGGGGARAQAGDFPSEVLKLHHYKTKSRADAMEKLRREGVAPVPFPPVLTGHAWSLPPY